MSAIPDLFVAEGFPDLNLQADNNVLIIKLNRPRALNALNRSVFSQLNVLFNQIRNQPSIRCIILTGEGDKAFAAGADISEFLSIPSGGAKEFLALGNQVMNNVASYPVPVIAAVNGFALGGGFELAMACHLRMASETAKFGLPEIKLGTIPGYGGTQRLSRLIGSAKAMEMMLTGEMINAQEALRMGIINRIVPPAQLIEKTTELASSLASKPRTAIKNIIAAVTNNNIELLNGIAEEGDLFTECVDTEDFREGVQAFIEKRKPNFLP